MSRFNKFSTWAEDHLLRILVVVLLVWIPLYPKLPLVDVMNTWVYIRLEDFLVVFSSLILIYSILRKKTSLKNPLTKPIFLYWLAGAISLIWAILFFAPQLPQLFPHLAFLHYLRRIEYMLLFFVVVASIQKVKDVYVYLIAFFTTLIGVIFYGFGQRFLHFPAFLTMNEEFSKGLPLYLPSTARITSTFGGHYDLAAYLVIAIALSSSLIFTLKRWWQRLILVIITLSSYLVLLLTASRISFIAYLLAISIVLFFHKKKLLIIPVVFLSIYLMMEMTGGASVRFGKTFRIEPVVFETKTGRPVATLKQFTASPTPTPGPTELLKTPAPSTGGEDLPTGSGFLPLPAAPAEIAQKPTKIVGLKEEPIFLESLEIATVSSEIATSSGTFLLATTDNYFVKKAIVYDISFTTRFQGEWPRAWEAFKRNLILGSGYSSVSLATDNDYLRSLGETGIFGFVTFWGIIFILILIIRQIIKASNQPLLRGLAIGLLGAVAGLLFNAVLIDVFEASKVAFVFWMVVGLVVGLAKLYPQFYHSLWKEAREVLTSPLPVLILLGTIAYPCFKNSLDNYFVGDDFNWLKWAATSSLANIQGYFFSSAGFFYRPLAKVLFLFIQPIFSLEPQGYHLVSLIFHFVGVAAVYFIALGLTRKKLVAFTASLLFLLHPIHEESIFWISSLSGLMAAVFYLLTFLFYLYYREEKRISKYAYWLFSIIFFASSLASHELSVTLPLMLIFYDCLWKKYQNKPWQEFLCLLPYFILLSTYLFLRTLSGAHNLSGDYSYRLANFPFNFIGNFFGYLGELLVSFRFVPLYQGARLFLRAHKLIAAVASLIGLVLAVITLIYARQKRIYPSRILVFCFGWLIIALLPFLGLGTITERYPYLASFGFVLSLVFILNWLFREQLQSRINRHIAASLFLITLASLSTFYYFELQRANRDWKAAGQISKNILLALSSNYQSFPPETRLIFTDLPVKNGLAWVYPVGLDEAVWFIYKDPTLKIYRADTLEAAFNLKDGFPVGNNWIFVLEDGELKKAKK